jgi:hypothetical protein
MVAKGCRQTVLLTLNSRKAAAWLREPEIEMEFANTFSEGSHIREQTYNIIIPWVPITFDPKNAEHL